MQKHLFIALLPLLSINSASAIELEELGRQLIAMPCYADSAYYEILLPNYSEPVTYQIAFESAATPADSLCPCSYITSWTLSTPSGKNNGFSAYFDGGHYRFHNSRLQEYHAEWEPTVFAPEGNATKGVQVLAQFAEFIPQIIGLKFTKMSRDTTYRTTISETTFNGRAAIKIKGVQQIAGFDAQDYTYIFDAATLHPVHISFDCNPGQLGEQSICANYALLNNTDSTCVITIERLLTLHGDIFERYRDCAYSIEALVGEDLPSITLPTADGNRIERRRGESAPTPTIIIFLDSSVGSTPQVISDVRLAMNYLPFATTIIWAFIDKRADDVIPFFETNTKDEIIAINAGAAFRDCGVGNNTPAIIFVASNGKVADIIRGYNKELRSLVIQKTTLAARGQ